MLEEIIFDPTVFHQNQFHNYELSVQIAGEDMPDLCVVLINSYSIYIQLQTNYQSYTETCKDWQRINQTPTTKTKYTDLSNIATVQNTSIM